MLNQQYNNNNPDLTLKARMTTSMAYIPTVNLEDGIEDFSHNFKRSEYSILVGWISEEAMWIVYAAKTITSKTTQK